MLRIHNTDVFSLTSLVFFFSAYRLNYSKLLMSAVLTSALSMTLGFLWVYLQWNIFMCITRTGLDTAVEKDED